MGCNCCGDVTPLRQYGGCGCCCEDPKAGGGGEPIPDWAVRWTALGMRDGVNPSIPGGPINNWIDEIQGVVLTPEGAGAMTAVSWRGTLAAVQSGATFKLANSLLPAYANSTQRSWLFALQIPPVIPAGNGPLSTFTDPLKNFPLYFKNVAGQLIMGSQPKSINCDVAVNLVAWLGLDAVILVQQGGGLNPRFSCFVDTIGPVAYTATTGEDPAAVNQGAAMGGWFGTGGEYPYPIGQGAEIDTRVLDAAADAEVLYWADVYGLTP